MSVACSSPEWQLLAGMRLQKLVLQEVVVDAAASAPPAPHIKGSVAATCRVEDPTPGSIARLLPAVEVLGVHISSDSSFSVQRAVRGHPQLLALLLSLSPGLLPDETWEEGHLGSLPRLQKLDVSGIRSGAVDALLEDAAACPALQAVNVEAGLLLVEGQQAPQERVLSGAGLRALARGACRDSLSEVSLQLCSPQDLLVPQAGTAVQTLSVEQVAALLREGLPRLRRLAVDVHLVDAPAANFQLPPGWRQVLMAGASGQEQGQGQQPRRSKWRGFWRRYQSWLPCCLSPAAAAEEAGQHAQQQQQAPRAAATAPSLAQLLQQQLQRHGVEGLSGFAGPPDVRVVSVADVLIAACLALAHDGLYVMDRQVTGRVQECELECSVWPARVP
jgi:hypothetical protein